MKLTILFALVASALASKFKFNSAINYQLNQDQLAGDSIPFTLETVKENTKYPEKFTVALYRKRPFWFSEKVQTIQVKGPHPDYNGEMKIPITAKSGQYYIRAFKKNFFFSTTLAKTKSFKVLAVNTLSRRHAWVQTVTNTGSGAEMTITLKKGAKPGKLSVNFVHINGKIIGSESFPSNIDNSGNYVVSVPPRADGDLVYAEVIYRGLFGRKYPIYRTPLLIDVKVTKNANIPLGYESAQTTQVAPPPYSNSQVEDSPDTNDFAAGPVSNSEAFAEDEDEGATQEDRIETGSIGNEEEETAIDCVQEINACAQQTKDLQQIIQCFDYVITLEKCFNEQLDRFTTMGFSVLRTQKTNMRKSKKDVQILSEFIKTERTLVKSNMGTMDLNLQSIYFIQKRIEKYKNSSKII